MLRSITKVEYNRFFSNVFDHVDHKVALEICISNTIQKAKNILHDLKANTREPKATKLQFWFNAGPSTIENIQTAFHNNSLWIEVALDRTFQLNICLMMVCAHLNKSELKRAPLMAISEVEAMLLYGNVVIKSDLSFSHWHRRPPPRKTVALKEFFGGWVHKSDGYSIWTLELMGSVRSDCLESVKTDVITWSMRRPFLSINLRGKANLCT